MISHDYRLLNRQVLLLKASTNLESFFTKVLQGRSLQVHKIEELRPNHYQQAICLISKLFSLKPKYSFLPIEFLDLQAEQELIRQNLKSKQILAHSFQQAKQLSKLDTELIEMLDHELRSPFRGMRGLSEIVLENSEESFTDDDKDRLWKVILKAKRG